MIIHLLFYIFATTAVLAALAVISARNPVRSVLALVLVFFCMAGIWMLLTAEFLSLVLLLVYVGAVMTLFLFVVMMLNIDLASQRSAFANYLSWAMGVVVLISGILILTLTTRFYDVPAPPMPEANYSNLEKLGAALYIENAYPFEIAGMILLAGIIAAMNLAHRQPRERRSQRVSEQVKVQARDRLQILSMPSEEKP